MDKSAIILEAQWIEKEIPRIRDELATLEKREQELLTTPMETVRRAYQDTYRSSVQRLVPFYHRRRRVVATRYGVRARIAEGGWFAIGFRVLMPVITALAMVIAFNSHRNGNLGRGVAWGSVLLAVGVALSFAPMLGAWYWERRARQSATAAAERMRASDAFRTERRQRHVELAQCRERMAELQEQLSRARRRHDELRDALISGEQADADMS